MSSFASVSPQQFKCVLFCTFLFGSKGAPEVFAGPGTAVDRGGVGRSRFPNNKRQLPDWELAARQGVPTTLTQWLGASSTGGLSKTQVVVILHAGERSPHCLPTGLQLTQPGHELGLVC